jgi:cation diffusion facilitator family transporter
MEDLSNIDYRQGKTVTLVGMVANLVLIVIKIVGGFASRSQALIADGIHSLSDLLSDFVVLVGLKWGRQSEDEDHPFGHGRIETLSSLLVGVLLIGAGVGMGVAAARDLYLSETHHPSGLAILIAFISVLSKEALYHYTRIVGKRINSPALMSNAWHHRSDALSSVAVIIGVAGAIFLEGWESLDSWAALLVSLLIAKVGASFIVSAIKEFIDTSPGKDVVTHIESCASTVDGVTDVHDLRARTSGGEVFVEIHITVNGDITVRRGHEVAKEVEMCLKDRVPHLGKAIVHVDPSEEEQKG